MSKTVAKVESRASRAGVRLGALDSRLLLAGVFLAAILFYLQFEFWKQPCEADRANWDYISQVIARGGVPYRDVVNIKTPLSGYIGAAAIVAGRLFGLRDVFAIRVVYLLLGALTIALTFLVARDYFKSRMAGLLSAAIMLSFTIFSASNSGGVQPKTPMILFGLMALWAIEKDRPFLAGAFGSLSALSWQPGLLFVGAAVLASSRYLTSWRDKKAIKVMAGAFVPLAICFFYFWAAGALGDFYRWNIDFNYSVYAPREARTVAGFFDRFLRMLKGGFRDQLIYFILAFAGLIILMWKEAAHVRKRGWRSLLRRAPFHAVVIAPTVYFLFCMVNIQGGADLIPLLPFIAMLAALSLVYAVTLMSGLLARVQSSFGSSTLEQAAFSVLMILIIGFNVQSARKERVSFPTLQDQDAEVAEIVSHLAPGDKIFAQGAAQILVLSGLTNASKHYFLDRGKDSYLDVVEPGGFNGWLERLKAERPAVVALDRTKTLDYKEAFFAWVREDYEEHKGRIFTYYVRKGSAQ